MSIRFTRKRLHVGFRARDWHDVWLQPAMDEIQTNPEGEAEIMLYSYTIGKAGTREPMEGEVKWHPLFDIRNCESDKIAERARLQKRFLADAYKYLVETDPEAVRTLEEELDQPGFSRWQTWFREAKKFKKTQMKQRDSRLRTRIQAARAGGLSQAEAQKEINSDTTDSAYESDDDGERPDPAQMPPPRRPASQKRKRKNYAVGDSPSVSKKQKRSAASSRAPTPYMRGANNSRTPSVVRSISTTGLEDYEDEVMDTSDPTNQLPPGPGPGILGEWGFAALNTPPATGLRPGQAASQLGRQRQPSQSANGQNEQDDPAENDEMIRRHEEEQNELYGTEDLAIEAAIRASVEPSVREEDDVIDTTEADVDDP